MFALSPAESFGKKQRGISIWRTMSIKKGDAPILRDNPVGIKQLPGALARPEDSVLCIEFEMSDGRVFGFPYSHLMHYRLEESPASSEKLTLEFSRHDVVISGRRLKDLRQLLQTGHVASICEMDSRYENVAAEKPFVSTIQVKSALEAR
jgi:hypothetical protein